MDDKTDSAMLRSSLSRKGFYRRRRGILEHLESGRISLFDAGTHDFLCLNAQSQTGTGSSIPPGVWIGSARKIWLLTRRQETERRIQRSLEKFERMGWIRRWWKKGQRGDYPILIARLAVRDVSGNDYLVNAEETADWRHPVLSPCVVRSGEPSVKRRRRVGEVSGSLQEGKNGRRKEKEASQAQAPPHFAFEGTHLRVSEKQDQLLGEAFPWVDRQREYRKADSWVEANPFRRPKQSSRFLHNWFSKIPIPKSHGDANAEKRQSADISRFDNVGRKAAQPMD